MAEIIPLNRRKQPSKPAPSEEACVPAYPNNLPLQPTPFIGREQELSEIEKLLNDPACRFLTLVGPGGIGKTRLAQEAASHRLGEYQNGVWFVPFVGVGSAEHIVPTIADSLNFQFYGPTDPKVQILNYLKEKRMLLLWDNFEHLLEGSGLVSEVLKTAPGVKCLVTSRELLRQPGEWAFKVKGMAYPIEEVSGDLFESYDSIRLFLQGAKRADTSFQLTSEESPFIARVCKGVEGMPLGIELASSWVRALSVKEIAREVERNLAFFAAERKDIPERHRNLQAVFEQSWGMLTREEQRVFRRMAVFRGGFTRDAAEKVAGATLPIIAGLIDKSFIRKAPSGRYQIHELMRQFGEEKLRGVSGERKKAQDRHAEYYAEFLHEREAGLEGGRQRGALDEITMEIENIRAGWSWALEKNHVPPLDKSLNSLLYFFSMRTRLQEGEALFREAVEGLRLPPRRSLFFARLLSRWGELMLSCGKAKEAEAVVQRSLGILRTVPSPKESAYSFLVLSGCYFKRDFGLSDQYARKCLALAREIGDDNLTAGALNRLGDNANFRDEEGNDLVFEACRLLRKNRNHFLLVNCLLTLIDSEDGDIRSLIDECVEICNDLGNRNLLVTALVADLQKEALLLGDLDRGKMLAEKALAISKETGSEVLITLSLYNWGWLNYELGQYQIAKESIQHSLGFYKATGNSLMEAFCLQLLGWVAEATSDLSEAERCYQESLGISRKIGYSWGICSVLITLGNLSRSKGAYDKSEQYLLEVLRRRTRPSDLRAAFQSGRTDSGVMSALVGWAGLKFATGEKEQALELLAFALPFKRAWIHDDGQRLYDQLQFELPPEVARKAIERGKKRTIKEVVEEVLGRGVEPLGEVNLRICLLGVPKVFFGDREISDKAWGRKKAKKLFCYLVMHQGRTFPCEVLVEAFWPKLPGKRGLDSLYTTISSIRQTLKKETGLEGQVVITEEGQCGLDPKLDIWLDVEEFGSRMKKVQKEGKEAGKQALSLWQGRFCEGWYDPWVMEAERSLNEKRLECLRKLGTACLKDGEYEQSIPWLEQALKLDELHEETCRSLMSAYAKTGRKKDMKETIDNLKRLLKKELGVAPEAETLELFERLTA